VLVVDMVTAYFRPGAELYLGNGIDGGLFFRKVGALRHFVTDSGSDLGEIVPELQPRPDELVIVKQYASAFFGTSLGSVLATRGIDTLVICGVSTSGCVRATAVDAISSGYVPIVVRQAVGDRDPRPHEANLFDLQAKYAEVCDEPDVVAKLRG
jgi:maleamate amidohydrolase